MKKFIRWVVFDKAYGFVCKGDGKTLKTSLLLRDALIFNTFLEAYEADLQCEWHTVVPVHVRLS